MTRQILFLDTTLRDGEQSPGATMNLAEKLRFAQQLERLGVDIIEAGFPAASAGDCEAVAEIAAAVSSRQVAGLARASVAEVDTCWQAIKKAVAPRIHIFLATSPLHMEYKLRKTPAEILDQIRASVSRAYSYTDNVQFSAEDASRSEPAFLVAACNAALECGATTINIPDTVGYAVPEEFAELVRHVMSTTRACLHGGPPVYGVHCHNDLGLAVANTLAAVRAGVGQVEVTVAGIGERAGNACLEEVAMALNVRRDVYNCACNIATEHIYPAARLLARITAQPIPMNKPIVGANAFAHESGIHQDGLLKHRGTYEIMDPAQVGIHGSSLVLGKHSGRSALRSKLEALGYTLDEAGITLVFDAMKKLGDLKKHIYDEDIEALVLEEVYRLPDTYRLLHVSVHTSDAGMPPTAAVAMTVDGEVRQHVGFGIGPIDALFTAIAALVGRSPKLEQYRVSAITGGTDAQGQVTVRLSENGYVSVGRGAHPDVINASARAYINALNRLVKRHNERTGQG